MKAHKAMKARKFRQSLGSLLRVAVAELNDVIRELRDLALEARMDDGDHMYASLTHGTADSVRMIVMHMSGRNFDKAARVYRDLDNDDREFIEMHAPAATAILAPIMNRPHAIDDVLEKLRQTYGR